MPDIIPENQWVWHPKIIIYDILFLKNYHLGSGVVFLEQELYLPCMRSTQICSLAAYGGSLKPTRNNPEYRAMIKTGVLNPSQQKLLGQGCDLKWQNIFFAGKKIPGFDPLTSFCSSSLARSSPSGLETTNP